MELHSRITGVSEDAVQEISVYFEEAWGNRTRIDYGSGMELNFLCWLLVYSRSISNFSYACRFCLEQLGVSRPEDDRALVIHVFWR